MMESFEVDILKIEAGRATAITSICRGGSDSLFVGLTSHRNVLVEVDPETLEVKDLGPIFEPLGDDVLPHKIHNALACDGRGTIWLGEGSGMSPPTPIPEFDLSAYGGGAVHSYDPGTGKFERHAVPVAHNSIHAMALSPGGRYLCGYTVPDNHFWSYDIHEDRVRDYGHISSWCCHCVIVDGNDVGYCAWRTSGMRGVGHIPGHDISGGVYLARCDLRAGEFRRTTTRLVLGREYGVAGNTGVDAWCLTRSGRVFGSTAVGGAIFEVLDGGESVRHVGKPVLSPRVGGMTEDRNGVIWGAAGYPIMHIFSFHPDDPGSMRDYGPVETRHPMCYFHAIAVMDDGTIFVGETDSGRSQLFRLRPK